MPSIATRKRAALVRIAPVVGVGPQSAKALLAFNQRQALAHTLAVEEHLQLLPTGVSPSASWCQLKHSLLTTSHHLAEAVSHSARIDPALADDYRELREEAERVFRLNRDLSKPPAEPVNIAEVVAFRNKLRQVIGEITVHAKCPTCDQDGGVTVAKMEAEIKEEARKVQEPSAVPVPPPVEATPAKAPRRKTDTLLKRRVYLLDILRR